ncbi:MAG: hypothetical protein LRY41_03110 [Candidatus Pacebacteria bacterium]|nr:hypothetical protein [Candidatus Paceibacterota bacterium]MCD8528287.1 hypothetical protein [Candidatus Paceibacterota bacterium]MCD8563976.1 hypothetical protein [Candidatus Paceibacterota bacterium]
MDPYIVTIEQQGLLNSLGSFLSRISGGFSDNVFFSGMQFLQGFGNAFAFFVGVVVPLVTIALVLVYVYTSFQIADVRDQELQKYLARIYKRQQEDFEAPQNKKWNKVSEMFMSSDSANWRIAIIEADSLLEELVTSLGYQGESLGEKMKNIDPGNFPYLKEAWEAHLIRNRIAHEGMEFHLDDFEKNRVFRLYEKVFMAAGFI